MADCLPFVVRVLQLSLGGCRGHVIVASHRERFLSVRQKEFLPRSLRRLLLQCSYTIMTVVAVCILLMSVAMSAKTSPCACAHLKPCCCLLCVVVALLLAAACMVSQGSAQIAISDLLADQTLDSRITVERNVRGEGHVLRFSGNALRKSACLESEFEVRYLLHSFLLPRIIENVCRAYHLSSSIASGVSS